MHFNTAADGYIIFHAYSHGNADQLAHVNQHSHIHFYTDQHANAVAHSNGAPDAHAYLHTQPDTRCHFC